MPSGCGDSYKAPAWLDLRLWPSGDRPGSAPRSIPTLPRTQSPQGSGASLPAFLRRGAPQLPAPVVWSPRHDGRAGLRASLLGPGPASLAWTRSRLNFGGFSSRPRGTEPGRRRMAEGPGGGGQRGDRAASGRAAEEEVVRRRCRRGEEAEVFQPRPEGPRSVASGPLVEERFSQMHLRKQVSYR